MELRERRQKNLRNLLKVPNYHPTEHVAVVVVFAFAEGCVLVFY